MRKLVLTLALSISVPLAAQTARVPLTDLGTSTYYGFEGGLYEHGLNAPPADHFAAALEQSARIQPLDANGNPSATGKIVMLSVGMSNTTQEFCAPGNPSPCTSWSFVGQATADPAVNHSTLVFVNGARGGQTSDKWIPSTAANYDLVRNQNLAPAGLSERQVQVAWLKSANAQPTVSLPAQNADAYKLAGQIGSIVRAMKQRYPNLRLVYLASRIYAGYATSALNPEPYAYETGLAVKWAIQAQIDQIRTGAADKLAGDLDYRTEVAPLIMWGPYLWTNGMSGRSDGLTWAATDVVSTDGTHPSTSGQQKVGALLLAFFKSDPTSRAWFLAPAATRRRATRR